jgi:hypothetical protein
LITVGTGFTRPNKVKQLWAWFTRPNKVREGCLVY